jgi:hypothetical protein
MTPIRGLHLGLLGIEIVTRSQPQRTPRAQRIIQLLRVPLCPLWSSFLSSTGRAGALSKPFSSAQQRSPESRIRVLSRQGGLTITSGNGVELVHIDGKGFDVQPLCGPSSTYQSGLRCRGGRGNENPFHLGSGLAGERIPGVPGPPNFVAEDFTRKHRWLCPSSTRARSLRLDIALTS